MNMKWIKHRSEFISEAKIRDVILKKQAKKISDTWGEKYLDYEEIEPTDKIKQGEWILDEEDKYKVLNAFFTVDMQSIFNFFKNLPQNFVNAVNSSVDEKLVKNDRWKSSLDKFNISSPSVDDIFLMYENVFKKIAIGETQATEVIQRDENGRPIMDENNRPLKRQKEKSEVIFTNNLVNMNTFIDDFNRCYPSDKVDSEYFRSGPVYNIRNVLSNEANGESERYDVDFEIFNKDISLSILHNPKDILNMSISKFFSSCQHLYSGGYNNQLLSNVFDINSIPAFLRIKTPIFWKGEKISDVLPISRMMIRNVESFNDEESKLFFDRAYTDNMRKIMIELVEKYSGNKNELSDSDVSREKYIVFTDVDEDDHLDAPYMDKFYDVTKGKYIGVNVKSLKLSIGHDWSKYRISPKAKIKELVIETPEIPTDVFKFKFNLEWLKFKFIKINSLSKFSIITDSLAFDKCTLNSNIIDEISTMNIKKLQLISCKIDQLDIGNLKNLEELHLIYTLSDDFDLSIIKNLNLKKLVVSGDLVPKNKKILSLLKRKKVEIKIEGPVI